VGVGSLATVLGAVPKSVAESLRWIWFLARRGALSLCDRQRSHVRVSRRDSVNGGVVAAVRLESNRRGPLVQTLNFTSTTRQPAVTKFILFRSWHEDYRTGLRRCLKVTYGARVSGNAFTSW